MKTLSALLIIVLFLICGCSKRANPEAKSSTVAQAKEAHHDDPDDPDTKVVSPLSILKEQAMPAFIKPEAEQEVRRELLPVDHPTNLPPQKSIKLLHKVFPVNKYAQFAFVVPPHQGNTRLRGTFRSFTKRSDPNSTSDVTADVDLMLLSEKEFDELLHGQPQSITYDLDPAHTQKIDWRVPTTYGDSQTYHLVFSNSGGVKTKFVEADFTVNFE